MKKKNTSIGYVISGVKGLTGIYKLSCCIGINTFKNRKEKIYERIEQ